MAHMKAKKKKLALPRRQWKISPVTRVKASAKKYVRTKAKRVRERMSRKDILKLGLPKGSLQDAAIAKMAKAGFHIHRQQPLLCALRR
jgi:hypothetical protein